MRKSAHQDRGTESRKREPSTSAYHLQSSNIHLQLVLRSFNEFRKSGGLPSRGRLICAAQSMDGILGDCFFLKVRRAVQAL